MFFHICILLDFICLLFSPPALPNPAKSVGQGGVVSGAAKVNGQSFFHSWRKKAYELNHIVLSVVAIRCAVAVEQPREGELPRGAVTIDQLRGNVQEDAVALLVRVVQRAVRHQEEVLRG